MNDDNSPVRDVKYSLIPCYFGAHRYEIYSDEFIKTPNGTIIGRNIITRCTVCGKIKNNYIKLLYTNEFI